MERPVAIRTNRQRECGGWGRVIIMREYDGNGRLTIASDTVRHPVRVFLAMLTFP